MIQPNKATIFIIFVLFNLLNSMLGFGQNLTNTEQLILIRNVRVIDQNGKTEDEVISILIDNDVLDVITKDEIPLLEVDVAFDAKEGVVLGTLSIGQLANFMILDEDPREKVEILLDTKSYTVFAIVNGKIELNTLAEIGADDKEDEKVQRFGGWQSYPPPPIALPITYQNAKKWNLLKTKPFTALLSGALLIDNTHWVRQNDANEEQVGDIDEYDGGSIRGYRAGLVGTINFKQPWSYLIYIASSAFERGFEEGNIQEIVLYEYRVNIPIKKVTMSLGKIKEPISMERLISLMYIPAQQERGAISEAFLRTRNIGIAFNSTWFNERMTWSAGVFNPWYESNRSFKEASTVFTGRITALPYITKDESNLLHIGVAGRYSNANNGIHYTTTTEIYRGPTSTDTGQFDADRAFTLGLELTWRKGPILLTSEYLKAFVKSSERNNPEYAGYHITVTYILTGEMRGYNKRSGILRKVPVAKSVNEGGWGSLDIYLRWSTIDLMDKIVDGGKMSTISGGINWWANSNIFGNIGYKYSLLDRFNANGSNQGIVVRLGFILD